MLGSVEAASASPPAKRPRRSGRAITASAARSAGAVEQAASGDEPQTTGSRRRKRKRRRVIEPPPPQVDAPDPCDSMDGDQMGFEHSGEAQDEDEAEDEAAALSAAIAATTAAAAAAAPRLSVHEQAVRLLMQSTGVPRDRALLALEESKAEAESQDPYDWQELAQIWLAERADFEDERDLLAETMRVSLEEAERRRAAQKPLVECSADEISQAFATSDLLRRLAERRSLPSLLQPPLRKPLLSYLELEKKCKRWYDAAWHFFSATAEQLAAQLGCGEERQKGAETGVSGKVGVPPLAGPSHAEETAAAAAGEQPVDEDEAAVLAVTLECQREEIQAAVFAMPQGDGVGLPALFAAAVPEGANQEVVVLESEDEEGVERQAAGGSGSRPPAQQQQQVQQQRQPQQEQGG
ncbi:hypothetical protein ACK3TF_000479 [Chlorella vulgaris]